MEAYLVRMKVRNYLHWPHVKGQRSWRALPIGGVALHSLGDLLIIVTAI